MFICAMSGQTPHEGKDSFHLLDQTGVVVSHVPHGVSNFSRNEDGAGNRIQQVPYLGVCFCFRVQPIVPHGGRHHHRGAVVNVTDGVGRTARDDSEGE